MIFAIKRSMESLCCLVLFGNRSIINNLVSNFFLFFWLIIFMIKIFKNYI